MLNCQNIVCPAFADFDLCVLLNVNFSAEFKERFQEVINNRFFKDKVTGYYEKFMTIYKEFENWSHT